MESLYEGRAVWSPTVHRRGPVWSPLYEGRAVWSLLYGDPLFGTPPPTPDLYILCSRLFVREHWNSANLSWFKIRVPLPK